MASEDDTPKSRIRGAMDEMMQTEQGKELAAKLREKLKELNEKFNGLSGEEKTKMLGEVKGDFLDSLNDLKDNLKGSLDDGPDGEFKFNGDSTTAQKIVIVHNYWPMFFAVLIIVLVFGFFGYKLYLSIMAKEMKREKKTRKQLKEEKKTQSPPASPRSKKET